MIISIITVNFNNINGLKITLESVERQTLHCFKHIIVDGMSTDGSVDIIKEYAKTNDNVITLIEPDEGPFFAMNKGVELATGDYCIFMNSGDSFYDEYVIDKFIGVERTKDIYTGVACEHLGDTIYQWNPARGIDINLKFFYRGALSHQSSFIKTSLIKQMKYDTRYRIAADWKFFLVALLKNNATYETLPFFVSHYMDGGISRDVDKAFAERDSILAECFTRQEINEVIRANEWDKLAQQVDPRSKIGNLIFIITKRFLSLRR